MGASFTNVLLAAALIYAGANAATAADADAGSRLMLRPTFFLSSDSDGFDTRRAGMDFLVGAGDGAAYKGASYRHHEFNEAGWSRRGEQVSALMKGTGVSPAQVWQAEAGVMRQGGHMLLTLDGNLALPLTKRMSTEIFVNRDFVETRAALDQGVHFTFAGASADYQLHPKLTLVGLVGRQHFSDDNRRNHGRLRLIFQPDLDLGLTFQYRYRFYNSTPNVTRRSYFNPERYQEHMLLSGWRYRRNGWVMNLLGGIGNEQIGETPNGRSRLLELSLASPANQNQQINLRAGYVQAASFGGPDYRYPYAQAQWTIKFD